MSISQSEVVPLEDQRATIELYGGLVDEHRLVYPEASEVPEILEGLVRAKHNGSHMALVDGAFDIPHENHIWRLRNCRHIAASREYGGVFDSADRPTKIAMVASDMITLIVMVDSDVRLAALKGNDPLKGNIERPVYPWLDRAQRVGGYMIPDGEGRHRPVADMVTVDGEPELKETALASHLAFGRALSDLGVLDTWIIPNEHGRTLERARSVSESAVCEVSSGMVRDDRTGEVWSTSYVVRRVTGQA